MVENQGVTGDNSFHWHVKVEKEHIDGLSHTNNSCYVSWCEQAAWAHSQKLGLGLKDFQQLDRAMAIRHADYDYIYSTYLDDELVITTWLSDISNLKMKRYFEIKKGFNEDTVLRACWDLVCIEISTGKPKRLPKEFVEAYGR